MDVLQKIDRAIAGRYDINVLFRGSRAYTDNKTIVLPALPENLTHKDKMMARGYNGHERGHIRHTDFNVLSQTFPDDNLTPEEKKLHTTWNYLEDIWIEREEGSEYVGEKKNMNFLANEVIKESDMKHPYMKLFVEGRRHVCGYDLDGPSYLDDVKKIFGADIIDRIRALNNTQDTMDMARDVVGIYENFQNQNRQDPQAGIPGEGDGVGNEKSQNQKAKGKGKSKAEGDESDEDGDGNGKSKGEGDEGDGAGGQSEGGEDGEDGDQGNGGQGKGDKEDGQDGDGDGEGEGEDGDSKGDPRKGYGNTFSTADGMPVAPKIEDAKDPFDGVREYLERAHDKAIADPNEYVIYDKSEDRLEPMREAFNLIEYNNLKQTLGAFNAMRGKVQSLFMARTQSRWIGGREEGRINPKALSRVKAGYKDVFREKWNSIDRDTAVTFLVDFSGSMTGKKLPEKASP